MRVYLYSQARQRLAELLDIAMTEDVVIRRRNGDSFVLSRQNNRATSPFDIRGMNTRVTTSDVLTAIRESRAEGTSEAD